MIPQELQEIINKRATEYGAHRVYVFGSLLKEGVESARDIDLAVEGIPMMNFYPFYGDIIGDVGARFSMMVDMVDMDNDKGMIIPMIRREGVVAYENER